MQRMLNSKNMTDKLTVFATSHCSSPNCTMFNSHQR